MHTRIIKLSLGAIRDTPEVPASDRCMRAPFFGEFFHPLVVGERAQLVEDLEALPDAKVARRQDIEAIQ